MVKLRFIQDKEESKSSSHCDKHDVEISVWNLTVKKNLAMDYAKFIYIENRMNIFILCTDKNMDHESWTFCR